MLTHSAPRWILMALVLAAVSTSALAGGDNWDLFITPILDRELEMGEQMQIQATITTAGKTVSWQVVSTVGVGSTQINSSTGLITYTAPSTGGGAAIITIRATSATDPYNTDTEVFVLYVRERIPSLGDVTLVTDQTGAIPGVYQEPAGYRLASAVDPTTGELWQLYVSDDGAGTGRLMVIEDAASASPTLHQVATVVAQWVADLAIDAQGNVVVVWAGASGGNIVLFGRTWTGSSWTSTQTIFTAGLATTSGIGAVSVACSPSTGGDAWVAWYYWQSSAAVGVRSAQHSGTWTTGWTTRSMVRTGSVGAVDMLICSDPEGSGEHVLCAYHLNTGSAPPQADVYIDFWDGSGWGNAPVVSSASAVGFDFNPTLAASSNGEHLWLAFAGEVAAGGYRLFATAAEWDDVNDMWDWPASAPVVASDTAIQGAPPALGVTDAGKVYLAETGVTRTISSQDETRPLVLFHNGAAWTTWAPSGEEVWVLPNSQDDLVYYPAAENAWVRSGQIAYYSAAALGDDGFHLTWMHRDLGSSDWDVAHRLLSQGIEIDDDEGMVDSAVVDVASDLPTATNMPAVQVRFSGDIAGTPTWVALASPNTPTLQSPGVGDHGRDLIASHRHGTLSRQTWPVADSTTLWLFDPVPDTATVTHATPGDESSTLQVIYSDANAEADELGLVRVSDLNQAWATPSDFTPPSGWSYTFSDTTAVDDEAPVAPEVGDPASYPEPGIVTNEAVIVRWQPTADVGGDWFYRFVADSESNGFTDSLIENGSFEWDPVGTDLPFPRRSTGWFIYPETPTGMTRGVVADISAPDGDQFYRITIGGSTTYWHFGYVIEEDEVDSLLTPNTIYLAQVRLKSNSWVRLSVNLTDPEGTALAHERTCDTVGNGGWQTLTLPVYVEELPSRMVIFLKASSPADEVIEIDDLRLTPLLPQGVSRRPLEENLISNMGFEEDAAGTEPPTDWVGYHTGSSTGAVSSAEAHSGSNSYRMVTGSDYTSVHQSIDGSVFAAGDLAEISAWVLSDGGTVCMKVSSWIDSGGGAVERQEGFFYTTSNSGSWEQVRVVTLIPEDLDYLRVSLCMDGTGGGATDTCWIDDVEVYRAQAGESLVEGFDDYSVTVTYASPEGVYHTHSGPTDVPESLLQHGVNLPFSPAPYTVTLDIADAADNTDGSSLIYGPFNSENLGYGDATHPFEWDGVIVQGLDGRNHLQLENLRKLLWKMRGGTIYFPPGRYLISEHDPWADIPDQEYVFTGFQGGVPVFEWVDVQVPSGHPEPDADDEWDPIDVTDVRIMGASSGEYGSVGSGNYLWRLVASTWDQSGTAIVLDFDPVVADPISDEAVKTDYPNGNYGPETIHLSGGGTVLVNSPFAPSPEHVAVLTDSEPLLRADPIDVFNLRGNVSIENLAITSTGRSILRDPAYWRSRTGAVPDVASGEVATARRMNLTAFRVQGDATSAEAEISRANITMEDIRIHSAIWSFLSASPGHIDLTGRELDLHTIYVTFRFSANSGSIALRNVGSSPLVGGVEWSEALASYFGNWNSWRGCDQQGNLVADGHIADFHDTACGFLLDTSEGPIADFSNNMIYSITAPAGIRFIGGDEEQSNTANVRLFQSYLDSTPMASLDSCSQPELLIAGSPPGAHHGLVAVNASNEGVSREPIILTGNTMNMFAQGFPFGYRIYTLPGESEYQFSPWSNYDTGPYGGEDLVLSGWDIPLIVSGNTFMFKGQQPADIQDNGNIGILSGAGPSVIHGNAFVDDFQMSPITDTEINGAFVMSSPRAIQAPIDLRSSENVILVGNVVPTFASGEITGNRGLTVQVGLQDGGGGEDTRVRHAVFAGNSFGGETPSAEGGAVNTRSWGNTSGLQ